MDLGHRQERRTCYQKFWLNGEFSRDVALQAEGKLKGVLTVL